MLIQVVVNVRGQKTVQLVKIVNTANIVQKKEAPVGCVGKLLTNKKIKDKRDKKIFSCEEDWEVNYLIDLIYKNFPQYNKIRIRNTIYSCCQIKSAPRLREDFVKCVMSKLL